MTRIYLFFLFTALAPQLVLSQTKPSHKPVVDQILKPSKTDQTIKPNVTTPGNKPSKTKPSTKQRTSKPTVNSSTINNTVKSDTLPIPTQSTKTDVPNNSKAENLSLEELKKIEGFSKTVKDVRRFDKSTISVLPVVLYSNGNDGKTNVQKIVGDVLISEKHYLNTYQTEISTVIEKLLSNELDAKKFWGLVPADKAKVSLKKQFKDSFSAPNLLNKIVKTTTGSVYSEISKNDEIGIRIKDLLEASDEPFKMLKIWKNASTLISRAEFTVSEAQKKANLDPTKYDNYKKLLMRNYIMVCTIENPALPEKQEIYRANVSGFLYRILWNDNLQNDLDKDKKSVKYNLEYVGNIKIANMDLDPRSDEFIDRYNLKSNTYKKNSDGEYVESVNSLSELFNKSIITIFDEMGRRGNKYFQDGEYQCSNRIYRNQIELSQKFPNLKLDIESTRKKVLECSKNIELSPTFNPVKFKQSSSEEKRARREWDENRIIPLSQNRRDKLLTILKDFFYSIECNTYEMNLYDQYIFAQSASNGILEEFEKYVEELKVRARVIKSNPILSDIGRQEGLFKDQRYRVYEQIKKADGSIELIKRASVRVVRVAENTEKYKKFNVKNSKDSLRMAKKEQFNYSKFKQIDGKQIEEGMLLEQDDDRGIGFQVGYLYMKGNSGLQIGIDYRFSKMFKKKAFTSGLKVGVDLGFYRIQGEYQKHSAIGGQIYISKEMYLSPKFDIKPVVGYNLYGGLYLGTYVPINIVGKSSQFSKFKIVPMLSFANGSSNTSISSDSGSDRIIVDGGLMGSLSLRFEL